MFTNLTRHSLRFITRQRSSTIINVLGLSVGIACSLIIALFVINELSYENFNLKRDRIFRLILNGKEGGQEASVVTTAAVIGPTMLKEVPEVEDFLRMHRGGSGNITYNNQSFVSDNILEADSSFFNFFSIPVLKGDPKNLLNTPRKVVLSESTSKKIFGD